MEEYNQTTLELLDEARKMQKIVSGKTLSYKETMEVISKHNQQFYLGEDEDIIQRITDEAGSKSHNNDME